MEFIDDLFALVEVKPGDRVASKAMEADGMKVVLFAFDAGAGLSEHSAVFPVMLQALDGALEVTAGRTVTLRPGGVVHLPARLPHSVVALEPTVMQLTMLGHHA